MVKLVNAAVMPHPGCYVMSRLSKDDFAQMLIEAFRARNLVSFIGYQSTADHIYRLTGVKIPISRAQTILQHNDVMLVCRLKYRLSDADAKREAKAQAQISDEDFEYFIVTYEEV